MTLVGLWANFRFRAQGEEQRELVRQGGPPGWEPLAFGAATIPTGPKPRAPPKGGDGRGQEAPALPSRTSRVLPCHPGTSMGVLSWDDSPLSGCVPHPAIIHRLVSPIRADPSLNHLCPALAWSWPCLSS